MRSDTPDIVEYEHVDSEQVAEKEQAASHAETDANLAKRAAVSKFKQHIAEEALEHQPEVEAEIRVEEETAAELKSQAETVKKSLEEQEVQQTVHQFQAAEEAKDVAAKEAARAVEQRAKATASEQQHAADAEPMANQQDTLADRTAVAAVSVTGRVWNPSTMLSRTTFTDQ